MYNFTVPSPKIDAAICNLLVRIYNFSDLDFETKVMVLEEDEIELVVVKLIEEVSNNLTGKLLNFYLQTVRQAEQDEELYPDFLENIHFE